MQQLESTLEDGWFQSPGLLHLYFISFWEKNIPQNHPTSEWTHGLFVNHQGQSRETDGCNSIGNCGSMNLIYKNYHKKEYKELDCRLEIGQSLLMDHIQDAWMALLIGFKLCQIYVLNMELECFLMFIVKKDHKMDLIMEEELGK